MTPRLVELSPAEHGVPGYGWMAIGCIQCVAGRYIAICREQRLPNPPFKSRKAAHEAVIQYWKGHYSSSALSQIFESHTVGGYRVVFHHGLKHAVVAGIHPPRSLREPFSTSFTWDGVCTVYEDVTAEYNLIRRITPLSGVGHGSNS